MNDEKIYRTMLKAILDQGKASLGPNGKAAYKGLQGLQSPVGFLIDDDLYHPAVEKWSPSGPAVVALVSTTMKSGISVRQEGILQEIENSHEQAIGAKDFRQEFVDALGFYALAEPFDTTEMALYIIEEWCNETKTFLEIPIIP